MNKRFSLRFFGCAACVSSSSLLSSSSDELDESDDESVELSTSIDCFFCSSFLGAARVPTLLTSSSELMSLLLDSDFTSSSSEDDDDEDDEDEDDELLSTIRVRILRALFLFGFPAPFLAAAAAIV